MNIIPSILSLQLSVTMTFQFFFLAFILLLNLASVAQNAPCSDNSHRVYVKLDNGYEGSITAYKGKNRLELAFSTLYFCTDRDAHVMIIFTDNTSVSIDKVNGFGCTTSFFYLYRRKDGELIKMLTEKNIQMFKVYGVDKNLTGILRASESQKLTASIRCLSKEIL